MLPSASICYDGKDLEEPLGGVPTVSLVLQVIINTVVISVLVVNSINNTLIVYIWNFFKLGILNPFMLRL